MQRPINKEYFYIDYHATIDAIKYRVFHLTEKVKQMYRPNEEKKDYHCPQCHAQWTQLEVLDSVGPEGFECHRCGHILDREESTAGTSTGHEKQSRLMSQLDGLLKMLQQVDSQEIPSNDFDTAFALTVPVPRDNSSQQSRPTVPISAPNGPPAAVKGLAQVTAAPLDVSVTTSSEKTAAEKAAEAQRKAEIAAQNVLPVWHTTSTVTGERTVIGRPDAEQHINSPFALRTDEEDKKSSDNLNDELTKYYAQLAEEKAQKAAQEEEAGDSSEDEDEEDFEDVGIGESGVDTPAQFLFPNENRQFKPSESESSAHTSNVPTPAAAAEHDGPSLKRVKFEKPQNGTGEQAAVLLPDNNEDEDDEAEFEDAL